MHALGKISQKLKILLNSSGIHTGLMPTSGGQGGAVLPGRADSLVPPHSWDFGPYCFGIELTKTPLVVPASL